MARRQRLLGIRALDQVAFLWQPCPSRVLVDGTPVSYECVLFPTTRKVDC